MWTSCQWRTTSSLAASSLASVSSTVSAPSLNRENFSTGSVISSIPRRLVRTLSIADKQMVEIAKALSYNASVLIMDEPTATLTEREAGTLLDLVDQLRKTGVTIVFISHILPQVLRVSDRITVLRDGIVVTTLEKR